jgi:hypothetical protein
MRRTVKKSDNNSSNNNTFPCLEEQASFGSRNGRATTMDSHPNHHRYHNNGSNGEDKVPYRHQQSLRKRVIQIAAIFGCVIFSFVSVVAFLEQLSSENESKGNPRNGNDRTSDRKWLQMQLKRPNQSKASDALTHRHKKTLPDFTNGGVVAFYHMYKTGGSTTGMMMKDLAEEYEDRFNFTMVREFIRWEEECLPALDMAQFEKKIVLLELHVEHPSPQFPSLVDLAPTMKRWRMEAHRRNLGFFAFTQVREAVSHSISFFNFFQVRLESYDRDWNPWRAQAPTETNLMHQFVPDRQCRMLGSDPEGTMSAPASGMWEPPPEPKNPDLRNCRLQQIYDAIDETMDWVGLTETLSNETLPLLSKLLISNATYGISTKAFKVFKEGKTKIRGVLRDDLSEASMARILQETSNDKKLYDDVRRNFTLTNLGWDQWFFEDSSQESSE